jgi:hypothetical protein
MPEHETLALLPRSYALWGFAARPQIFPALAAREFHRQRLIFVPEGRGSSLVSSPKLTKFPVSSRATGNKQAETSSPMTSSTATNSILDITVLFVLAAFRVPPTFPRLATAMESQRCGGDASAAIYRLIPRGVSRAGDAGGTTVSNGVPDSLVRE